MKEPRSFGFTVFVEAEDVRSWAGYPGVDEPVAALSQLGFPVEQHAEILDKLMTVDVLNAVQEDIQDWYFSRTFMDDVRDALDTQARLLKD